MSTARRVFLLALAGGSAGLALWVLVAAALADKLSGQVFFAILPLVMLFGIAWRGLTGGTQ
jgi:hypothetical protein